MMTRSTREPLAAAGDQRPQARLRPLLRFAAAGLAVLVAFLLLRPKDPVPAYRAGGAPRPLPTTRLAPVTGQEFAGILVGLRGRPVVVNVWASWCPPCRAEMPLLERAGRTYRGRVAFVGVDSKDDRAAAAAFLDEVGVSYANVFDGSGDVRRDLLLRGFPTTYLFGPDGTLRTAVVGGISEQRLAAHLDDLLR